MPSNLHSERTQTSPALGLSALVQSLAPQDWLMFAYLSGVMFAAWLAPEHANRTKCILQMSGLWLGFSLVTLLVRSRGWQHPAFASVSYRVTAYLTLLLSYLFLDDFLPLVNPKSLDQELYALDLYLFGVEPSVEWDRYVTPFATEWFSFFYFSYFYLVIAHIVPIAFVSKSERLLAEFGFGLLFVYTVGQTLYMFVPGFGPIVALADQFAKPFPSGFWLNAVMTAVHSGGANKDIFPSLHTGATTFIALFAFRHRSFPVFRYSWLVTAFFAVNIVIATMYLRWHWLIDVVAGAALAVGAVFLSEWMARRELERRARLGLGHSWGEV